MSFKLLALISIMVGCKSISKPPEDSSTRGFGHSSLVNNSSGIEWQKAEQAVCLLEKNGWTEIPEKYLPRGYTHSDLMRHMACVSNKESTFGAAVYGPNTGCGNAFGYWQIASCHMGQSVRGFPQYRCPATNVNTLANNFDVSAQCALYVYMEAAYNGRSGVGPWEATCSKSEWAANRRDGSPLFPVGCGYAKCFKNIKMAQNNSEFNVTVDNSCGADSIEAIPLEANGSTIVKTGDNMSSKFVESSGLKTATLSLAGLTQNFNRLRIRIKEGSRVLWTSNPSPSISLSDSGGSSTGLYNNTSGSNNSAGGSSTSSTSGNVEPSIMPIKLHSQEESQLEFAPIEEDPGSY